MLGGSPGSLAVKAEPEPEPDIACQRLVHILECAGGAGVADCHSSLAAGKGTCVHAPL